MYYIYYTYGNHGDNKLHIYQNISATAFFCCFHHIITYVHYFTLLTNLQ